MLTTRMPPLPQRMLAGISGGADSVALMYLLREKGVQVTAVHVNHGLRGAASDGDEAFVRELCQGWNVPLWVFRAEPPENPGEDWAREARYGFFRRAARETGISVIALAHHRDDQAETLLLHLLRGAGLTGLGAMESDVTVDGLRILRPLLDFSRQELRELLIRIGQPWREDESNGDARYLRNALRRDILPQLEALIPGAAARLANTAALLREEEWVLDQMTADFLRVHGGGRCLSLQPLREQPLALRRRILRVWWQKETNVASRERSLSSQQTEAFVGLIDARVSSRCNLPGGWLGQTGFTHLHLIANEKSAEMAETPVKACPLLQMEKAEGRTGDGKTAQAFPAELLESLTVRSRRPGDWIRPFGSAGKQSLQDYLVNRRVDAPFRDRVPLVCRGSEVLLAGGVGAGDIPRMDSDKEYVRLCWKKEFPWHRD